MKKYATTSGYITLNRGSQSVDRKNYRENFAVLDKNIARNLSKTLHKFVIERHIRTVERHFEHKEIDTFKK